MTQFQCKLFVVGLQESEIEFLDAVECADFQIRLFDTDEEILEQINNNEVDLIIVDASIPHPVQLCQEIREATEAPIALLLTSADLADLDSMVNAPIDRFFLKPLAIPEVLVHLHALHRRMSWQKELGRVTVADASYQPNQMYCCYHSA
jgi:DNA-binding response OmpR family regulator